MTGHRDWAYSQSGDYHRNLDPNWSYTPTYLRRMSHIGEIIRNQNPGARILDAGCGEGVLVEKYREEGYDIVGHRRRYKNNPHNNPIFDKYDDVFSTCCFLWNTNKVTKRNFTDFEAMCRGALNPLGHPIIDFFDPVSFDILHNGGKPYYIEDAEMHEKWEHFSAVGSGMVYYKNPESRKNVSPTYVQAGLDGYKIFCNRFYGGKM